MADAVTQVDRLLSIDTPVGPDKLLIKSFSGYEAMSNLFRYDVDLVVDRADAASIKAEDIIGQKFAIHVSLTSEYGDSPRRHFSGIVSRFVQRHADRRFVHFSAELVPWLWLLTQTADCRIFQEQTVPDIVTKILNDLKGRFSNLVSFRFALQKSYTKLDYCVQYRETSFQFISRLLEQEGIFYFFEHEKDKHTLVIADTPTVHKPVPDQPTAVYVPDGGWADYTNPVLTWEHEYQLRPGKYTLRDFHMQMPTKSLEVAEPTKMQMGNNSSLEVYDYPGEYARRFNKKERQGEVEAEGAKLIKLRMEEEETPHAEIASTSYCRGFTPGYSFKLTEHFSKKANAKYVITTVHHSAIQVPWYIAEDEHDDGSSPYQNSLTCIPAEVPYRPPRKTPKPIIPGTQTAMVVGPGGEEIYADEFSRVKVQFHWDRQGKKDEKSSCWVRVATDWAGKQWGIIHIPRIGQEVIVDFLEGDPDQPIIIGSVYNADMMPPYTLPDNSTQSGIKTRSSKNGSPSNFNEIRFEDKKGQEELYIHSEKDNTYIVENNRTKSIGNDESTTVGHDRTETVDNDETITIGKNRTESVGKDETITISGNRSLSVAKDETIEIQKNETISITEARTESVGKDSTVDVGKNFTLNAGDSITLRTGDASIVMKKNGDITIKGKDITVNGSGEIDVKASKNIVMKGSKILQN